MHENPFTDLPSLAGIEMDLVLAKVEAFAYRCATERPIRSSFGTKQHRQTVIVRVEDHSGHEGWGEVWCNFPPHGAEHRANLIEAVLRPLLIDQPFSHPFKVFETLDAKTHKLALQCGESGPFAQIVAAVDTACWDLVARRAGQPLWRLLNGAPSVPVYASGLELPDLLEVALQKWEESYRAFKLKIGFDVQSDLANLRTLRESLPPEARLMVDANQAWTMDEAMKRVRELAPYHLEWLEEPLACDRPNREWQALAEHSKIPLAAGENLRGRSNFNMALQAGYLEVFQPDIGKWGGVSGCYAVGKMAVEAGRKYCPHWLGGGIGQMASMHVLSAVGAPGLLEIDSKPNPFREELGLEFKVEDGKVSLPEAPGICGGIDLARIERFRIRP